MQGNWKIAGESDGAAPVLGTVYDVTHSRKGRFMLRATGVYGEWLTGEIVEGVAGAMMSYNVRGEGEEITIRDVHSYLRAVARAPTNSDPETER